MIGFDRLFKKRKAQYWVGLGVGEVKRRSGYDKIQYIKLQKN